MAVPQRRTSKTRKRMRRSHHALKYPGIHTCPSCGETKLPHRACGACGQYKGRQVLAVKEATGE